MVQLLLYINRLTAKEEEEEEEMMTHLCHILLFTQLHNNIYLATVAKMVSKNTVLCINECLSLRHPAVQNLTMQQDTSLTLLRV
jgi:hypothetical protein